MKKVLFLALCLVMTITASASLNNTYEFTYDSLDLTIAFTEDTTFSFDERQYIADCIAYGNIGSDEVSTYAWCWLTGHDIKTEAVVAVQHKVSPDVPRCYEITYTVESCNNCDYMESTPICSVYINCCPED